MVSEDCDEIPLGLYLLRRIRELGCKTVQGLPGMSLGSNKEVTRIIGDFNLGFLDLIKLVDGLKWNGNCNELNAAYSADGSNLKFDSSKDKGILE